MLDAVLAAGDALGGLTEADVSHALLAAASRGNLAVLDRLLATGRGDVLRALLGALQAGSTALAGWLLRQPRMDAAIRGAAEHELRDLAVHGVRQAGADPRLLELLLADARFAGCLRGSAAPLLAWDGGRAAAARFLARHPLVRPIPPADIAGLGTNYGGQPTAATPVLTALLAEPRVLRTWDLPACVAPLIAPALTAHAWERRRAAVACWEACG